MAIINDVNEVLHRIRVKLYKNTLPDVEGQYIARTDDEASLDIEQICAALKNRGGSTAQYEDLVEHVKQFCDEAAYQICDGFSINLKYFSVHPKVGGTFNSAVEGHTETGHPVSFGFRTRQPLRDLARHIEIFIEGLAPVEGYIAEVIDVNTGAVNETLSNGGQIIVTGHKIKIAGTNPNVGLFFVGQNGAVLVHAEHLAENSQGKLITVVPGLNAGQWKMRVVTQFASGGTLLKDPRTIESANLTVS